MNDQMDFLTSENLDRDKLKNIYEELSPAYEQLLHSVYLKVRDILDTHGIFPTINYRVKRFEAYYDKLIKMSRLGKNIGSTAITDILGLRIICPFLEDLEAIESLIKTNFHVIELDRKGAQHSIKEFGYKSVHFLVKIDPLQSEQEMPYTSADVCEVQLRTILQEAWAEVEHELIYKSDITLPIESIRRKLASLNAMLTLSDLIFQEIRDYQKEIRERDRRRRQSLEIKLAAVPNIAREPSFPSEQEKISLMSREIDFIIGEASLEKALFAALEAHSMGRLEEAIKIYTSILRLKVQNKIRSLVYNHRGMAYFGLAAYQNAIGDFSRSIHYDPENARCYNNRGLTFRVLRRYERSLEDYDRSVSVDPCQIDGFWGRAQTLYEMKLYSQALADCKKVLSIQSDFMPAQLLIKRLHKIIF